MAKGIFNINLNQLIKYKMEIYLRAVQATDYEYTHKWRNNRNITKSLGGNTFYISIDREKKWIEASVNDDSKNLHLIICLEENHQPIGMVNLTSIDLINRKAEFSIQVGDAKLHGKGIGEQATRLILTHGFNELNLNKIYLKVIADNEKAIKLYQKIGYIEEGILKQDLFKMGKYHDVIIMAIFKSDFVF